MKKWIIAMVIMLGLGITNDLIAQNLPTVNAAQKSFDLYMDNADDTPLIYGYETADQKSKKMICFSTMTVDVDGNPHKCMLGAYYTTEGINIEYLATEGGFVKLKWVSDGKSDVVFYIEKKFVKFE